jgi:translation initiation factor eIF-2B subunit epsilon
MDKCSVVDSHLWGNVLIEEGAKLNGVIVCEGGIVRKGAVVERGCVIGRGCIVGEGVTLKEFTRITLAAELEDEDDFSGFEESSSEEDEDSETKETNIIDTKGSNVGATKGTTNHDIVGPDGLGRVWTPSLPEEYDSDEEDDAEEALAVALELMKSQSIGYDMTLMYRKWKQLQMEDDDNFSEEGRVSDEEEDDMEMGDEWNDDDILDSNAAVSHLDEEGMQITGRQKGVDVVKELRDICLEHETSSPVENLRIELNSFKFSQNATYSDCCKGAIMAVLDKILEKTDSPSPGKLVASLKKMLEYWGPLFQSICMGAEEEKAIIHALEIMAIGVGKSALALGTEPAFRFVLQTLHDQEIVNEEAIFDWAAERKEEGTDTPRGKLFFQKPTQDFLEWLEEESDDESESGDDEDSD